MGPHGEEPRTTAPSSEWTPQETSPFCIRFPVPTEGHLSAALSWELMGISTVLLCGQDQTAMALYSASILRHLHPHNAPTSAPVRAAAHGKARFCNQPNILLRSERQGTRTEKQNRRKAKNASRTARPSQQTFVLLNMRNTHVGKSQFPKNTLVFIPLCGGSELGFWHCATAQTVRIRLALVRL